MDVFLNFINKGGNIHNVYDYVAKGEEGKALCELNKIYDLEQKDEKGRNALHWAAILGDKEKLESLVENFPDEINCYCKRGYTALYYANKFNNDKAYEYLLGHTEILSVKVESVDFSGRQDLDRKREGSFVNQVLSSADVGSMMRS
ncbi:ankyrin repeat domain-containing protein [Rickettsiales bacterium]|nr:ankyrin repeat domain-containing protein [Rickettsiales bacterium]